MKSKRVILSLCVFILCLGVWYYLELDSQQIIYVYVDELEIYDEVKVDKYTNRYEKTGELGRLIHVWYSYREDCDFSEVKGKSYSDFERYDDIPEGIHYSGMKSNRRVFESLEEGRMYTFWVKEGKEFNRTRVVKTAPWG